MNDFQDYMAARMAELTDGEMQIDALADDDRLQFINRQAIYLEVPNELLCDYGIHQHEGECPKSKPVRLACSRWTRITQRVRYLLDHRIRFVDKYEWDSFKNGDY